MIVKPVNRDFMVIVPARGGSKGIPGKNLQPLGAAPLLHWAVRVGQALKPLYGVHVSTDYDDIAEEGRAAGANILRRPDALSQDGSTVVDMVHYHLDALGDAVPKTIVYLEPTSPIRFVAEVEACVNKLHAGGHDAVATFTELNFHPTWLLEPDDNGQVAYLAPTKEPWRLSEQSSATYALTGAAYVFDVAAFRAQKPGGIFFGDTGHIVQTSAAIDIDTIFELETARAMLAHIDTREFEALGLV